MQKEQSRECKSKRIQEMHRRVCQIKASEKAEVKYMQTWEEKILIKQERLEEKKELTRKLANKFSIEQIAEILEIDISEVENILKKTKVKYIQSWEKKNMNKVDKGFELVYWKLSYRRKFIRTLWMIPWAIVALIFIQIVGRNYKYTILAGIIYLVILPIQAIYNYKKWMKEEMK